VERPARPTEEMTGLYGHRIGANMAAAAAAEAIGTFVLVLAIIATAIPAALGRPLAGGAYNSLAVVLANGLALLVLVAAFGHVSGAHFNPAVTLGLAVTRKFPWSHVPAYLVAQLGGALIAALIAWVLYGTAGRSLALLGATQPTPGVGAGRVFLVEAVVTFVLVLVIMSVATDRRARTGVAATAAGLALAAAVFIAGPLSGGAVNPARALGPMIVAGAFTDVWAYIVAPIVGGIVAAFTYDRLLRKAVMPEQHHETMPEQREPSR
jgi:MIP family channel proteins